MNAESDKSLDGVILEHFRLGVSRVYGRRIWQFLWKEFRGGLSQRKIACAAGFDQGKVSVGARDGTLTFPQLVALMMGMTFEFGDLPEKPTAEALAQGGFICCMEHVRNEVWKRQPKIKLDGVAFELLLGLWRDKRWLRAKGPENAPHRAELVVELRNKVSSAAKERLEKQGSRAVNYLEELETNWIETWDQCVHIVWSTYQWTPKT